MSILNMLSKDYSFPSNISVIWLPTFEPRTFHARGRQIDSNINPNHLANYLSGIRSMPPIMFIITLQSKGKWGNMSKHQNFNHQMGSATTISRSKYTASGGSMRLLTTRSFKSFS